MSTAVCSATCCISREPSPRPRQEGSQIPIAMGNVGDKAKRWLSEGDGFHWSTRTDTSFRYRHDVHRHVLSELLTRWLTRTGWPSGSLADSAHRRLRAM